MLALVKQVHVICAVLSILGFTLRGILMMKDSPMMRQRWIRIAPHIIDTLLLVSAVTLVVQYGLSPLEHEWLMTKIIALLLYIGLGFVALRHGKTKQVRVSAWILALATYAYIVMVAVTKSPAL